MLYRIHNLDLCSQTLNLIAILMCGDFLSTTRRIRIRVEREITKNQDQLNQLLDNYEEVIRTLETFVEMFK
ncbi:MAG: hypothetical protein DI617_01860 [Streptococcus pyogenes]|nr:MAG: hypothetical protein DI617_01860 [Streptococcus pyogenes]